jgi:hypothetical protein
VGGADTEAGRELDERPAVGHLCLGQGCAVDADDDVAVDLLLGADGADPDAAAEVSP